MLADILNLSLVAYAAAHGGVAWAGVLVAIWGAGSFAGGSFRSELRRGGTLWTPGGGPSAMRRGGLPSWGWSPARDAQPCCEVPGLAGSQLGLGRKRAKLCAMSPLVCTAHDQEGQSWTRIWLSMCPNVLTFRGAQPLHLARCLGCSSGCSSPRCTGDRVGTDTQVRTLADLLERQLRGLIIRRSWARAPPAPPLRSSAR
jgi:hypothetical protein